MGLILWLWSGGSWVFVGYDMSLNFVVVRFVGEDVLDGVAVSLVAGRG